MRSKKALVGLLTPPLLWLVVAYLGALAAIFATAFWTTDPFTNQVVRTFTTESIRCSPAAVRISTPGKMRWWEPVPAGMK